MKHLQYGLFFICLFFSLNLQAQQNHFVYIQTDNKQPFYVKLDKMVYSSTGAGYIIIPKLTTGNYTFVIGFPKNEWPEQRIRCSVDDKDLGYLLKNFGEKGWGLFNLQSLKLLMAEDTEKKGIAADVRSDAFSNMLAIVVNDSTIKLNEYANEEIKKPASDVVKVEQQQSTVVATAVELPAKEEHPIATKPAIEVAKTEEQPLVPKPAKDMVTQTQKTDVIVGQILLANKFTKKTADGIEMVYVDTEGGVQDTVTIFIPDKDASAATALRVGVANTKETKPAKPEPISVTTEEKKNDSKFLEIELPNPNTATANQVNADSMVKQNMAAPRASTVCKSVATNNDFLKLRKKMAAEDSPENMINVAKKTFKSKCFTTEQVKNLSVLFLQDAGKYDFFDTAYPFVSDTPNFVSLEGELTDSYYIKRFKVLIEN